MVALVLVLVPLECARRVARAPVPYLHMVGRGAGCWLLRTRREGTLDEVYLCVQKQKSWVPFFSYALVLPQRLGWRLPLSLEKQERGVPLDAL